MFPKNNKDKNVHRYALQGGKHGEREREIERKRERGIERERKIERKREREREIGRGRKDSVLQDQKS